MTMAVETLMASTENVLAPKKNRIQVSNTKKPLFFYVNLAKRYIQQHNEVELSALGMAITTVVTIAEILKNNGVATEKKVLTSSVGMKDENRGRVIQKAKIEIVLEKSEKGVSSPAAASTGTESMTTDTKIETATTATNTEPVMTPTTAEPATTTTTAEPATTTTTAELAADANEKK